jgi:uncharacterized membrane protein YccC
MSAPWLVRSARNTKKDRALLKAFSCADRAFRWQAEVEDFIRAALFDWAFEPASARGRLDRRRSRAAPRGRAARGAVKRPESVRRAVAKSREARLTAVERRLGVHLRYLARHDPDERDQLAACLRRIVDRHTAAS